MRGSTFKRCPCPAQYDSHGKKKPCPKRHGTWWYRLDAGRDPTTRKRHQVSNGGFGMKQQAQEALSRAITEVQDGSYRHDDRLTVAGYLARWLEDKELVLRATTLRDYQKLRADAHLVPKIGEDEGCATCVPLR